MLGLKLNHVNNYGFVNICSIYHTFFRILSSVLWFIVIVNADTKGQ